MKHQKISESTYMLRLEKEEKVIASIESFHRDVIQGAACNITGIGAIKNITLGYAKFNEENRVFYDKKTFEPDHELLHLAGNIVQKEGTSFAHCHVTLGNEHFQVIGGHLFEAEVAMTAELIITVSDKTIERNYDSALGLYLLDV